MLHSRPVQKNVTSATNLDIERILEEDAVSDDEKMKMYSTALTRYLSATKNNGEMVVDVKACQTLA